jgi:hypothetical protein
MPGTPAIDSESGEVEVEVLEEDDDDETAVKIVADRKYHGHQILPPDVLFKLKNEFHKKYGHD